MGTTNSNLASRSRDAVARGTRRRDAMFAFAFRSLLVFQMLLKMLK
jgi:hypothetical protein